jgi:hypothetical protein
MKLPALFSRQQSTPVAPQQQNNNNQQQNNTITTGTPNDPNNGTLQNNPNAAPNAAAAVTGATSNSPGNANTSPLDVFSGIFDDTNTPKGGSAPQSFAPDPKNIREIASKLNFGAAITPEVITAIQGGGEGAVKALQHAMNQAGQAAFAAAVYHSGNSFNDGLTKTTEHITSKVPTVVKSQQASTLLYGQNPQFNHPAVKPLVESLRQKVETKFPDATPEEIAEATKFYFEQFHKNNTPEVADPTKQAGSGGTDWSTFGQEVFSSF